MASQGAHISDQDLLMALDGEQSAPRTEQVRAHLADCWVCRTRAAEIDHTIQRFVRTYHRDLDPSLLSVEGRSLLKVRLADLAMSSRGQGRWLFAPLRDRRFVCACLALALGRGYLSGEFRISPVG